MSTEAVATTFSAHTPEPTSSPPDPCGSRNISTVAEEQLRNPVVPATMFLNYPSGIGAISIPLAGSVPMATLLVSSNGTVTYSPSWNLSSCIVVATSISFGSVTASRVESRATGNSGISSRFTVFVDVHVAGIDVSSIEVSSDILLVLTVLVVASGPCLPSPNFTSVLTYFCTLSALRPTDSLRSSTASTFQSSTTVSSVTGNPMAALSNTGMVSILNLEECFFSDVERLENSISPIPASLGDPVGQYYRGAIVLGSVMYVAATVLLVVVALAVNRFGERDDGFLMMRLPSSLMLVVGMFHQGMVTCGVSLMRIATSWNDTLLGAVGVGLGVLSTLGVLVAMTVRLACKMEDRIEKEKPLAVESSVPGLATLLRLAVWNKHWTDDGSVPGYKRRYLWLLDDLRLPWWAALELSSGLVQGGILGVRLNDLDVCRKQRIAMLVHCIAMFLLAAAVRPCGSTIGNAFLIAAKLCGTMVAVFIMVHTQTTDTAFATGASVVTSIFAFLSTAQAVCQLISAVVLGSRSAVPALRKLLAEDDNGTAGGVTSANIRKAYDSDEDDVLGDELMRELLSKAEKMETDELIDLLLEGNLPLVSPEPSVPRSIVSPDTAKSPSFSGTALPVEADDFLNDLLKGLVTGPPLAPIATMRFDDIARVAPPQAPQQTNPFGDNEETTRLLNLFAHHNIATATDPRPIALQEAARRSSLGLFVSSAGRETTSIEGSTVVERKRAGTSATAARRVIVRPRGVSTRQKPHHPSPGEQDYNGFDSDFDELVTGEPTKKTQRRTKKQHRFPAGEGEGDKQISSMLYMV